MKPVLPFLALLAVATPVAAPAQTQSDDVRCMLLSAGFARAVKDEASRRASAMTGSFYLGRLSGLSQAQLAAAMRAQGKGLSTAKAEPIMRACAARASAAEKVMTGAAQQAGIGR